MRYYKSGEVAGCSKQGGVTLHSCDWGFIEAPRLSSSTVERNGGLRGNDVCNEHTALAHCCSLSASRELLKPAMSEFFTIALLSSIMAASMQRQMSVTAAREMRGFLH